VIFWPLANALSLNKETKNGKNAAFSCFKPKALAKGQKIA